MDMNNEPRGFALIDRLATGDLDDDARRELFAWLDREPSGWRRCALALLESRELEQAFAQWRARDCQPVISIPARPTAGRHRRGEILALAASVMIAFSLGVFARGFWAVPARTIVAAPDKVNPKRPAPAHQDHPDVDREPSSPDVVQQPNEAAEKTVATVSPNNDPIPSYVRSQWERRGYHVKSQTVKLPVILPDGNRLMLPANEVQFNYVGQRTY